MTLLELLSAIEEVAMQQPSINMLIRNNIYDLNNTPDLKYGVFAWTQGQHTGRVYGMQSYQFTLFYVDRLREDKENMVEIQSVGCNTLGNILRLLEERDIEVSNYSLTTFNQRFVDECAGVYAQVTLQVPATYLCAENNF